MSTCDKCGAPRDDASAPCPNCGHSSAQSEVPPGGAISNQGNLTPSIHDRPTGGGFIICGWVFIALSVAAWLLGRVLLGSVSTARFNAVGQMMASGSWLTESAGTLFGYGIFLLAVGYLIRAIWFVPGPERKTMS